MNSNKSNFVQLLYGQRVGVLEKSSDTRAKNVKHSIKDKIKPFIEDFNLQDYQVKEVPQVEGEESAAEWSKRAENGEPFLIIEKKNDEPITIDSVIRKLAKVDELERKLVRNEANLNSAIERISQLEQFQKPFLYRRLLDEKEKKRKLTYQEIQLKGYASYLIHNFPLEQSHRKLAQRLAQQEIDHEVDWIDQHRNPRRSRFSRLDYLDLVSN